MQNDHIIAELVNILVLGFCEFGCSAKVVNFIVLNITNTKIIAKCPSCDRIHWIER